MGDGDFFKAWELSASGLHAEWVRMQIIANNIANAETTETPQGGPYRKQYAVFATLLNELSGVQVRGVVPSRMPLRRVYKPGHPDADEQGYVAMPNVKLPVEMVDMMMASRAYQANLTAMQTVQRIYEQAIKLIG